MLVCTTRRCSCVATMTHHMCVSWACLWILSGPSGAIGYSLLCSLVLRNGSYPLLLLVYLPLQPSASLCFFFRTCSMPACAASGNCSAFESLFWARTPSLCCCPTVLAGYLPNRLVASILCSVVSDCWGTFYLITNWNRFNTSYAPRKKKNFRNN